LKLNAKVIRWTVLLYIILVVPISLFHEYGHATVCAAAGDRYRIWVDFSGGHEECFNAGITRLFSYNTMGGVFGLVASGVIIAIGVGLNRQPAVLAVGLAYTIDQFTKVVLEGFFTLGYVYHRFDVLVTVIQVASWIGFMIYFARVHASPKLSESRNV
jgi:hypothetical protein